MIKFAKMSAAGNDFILFDNREKLLKGNEQNYFRDICQRRFSVGADGVILLERSRLVTLNTGTLILMDILSKYVATGLELPASIPF
jgi:diaminopimelate epimerase